MTSYAPASTAARIVSGSLAWVDMPMNLTFPDSLALTKAFIMGSKVGIRGPKQL